MWQGKLDIVSRPYGRRIRPEAYNAASGPQGRWRLIQITYAYGYCLVEYVLICHTGHKVYSKNGAIELAEIWICCRAGSIQWGQKKFGSKKSDGNFLIHRFLLKMEKNRPVSTLKIRQKSKLGLIALKFGLNKLWPMAFQEKNTKKFYIDINLDPPPVKI